MREEPAQGRNIKKYCEYHKDSGHTTRSYKTLTRAIDQISKDEEIQKFPNPPDVDHRRYQNQSYNKVFEEVNEDMIFVIMGGDEERKK